MAEHGRFASALHRPMGQLAVEKLILRFCYHSPTMIGSIGTQEIFFIVVIALVVVGP